jgi:3-deoxy-D-manno-octulosonic-acid transferase
VSLIGPLVTLLEQHCPDRPIIISSHTASGVQAARLAYVGRIVFSFPLDFSFIQQRLMARLKPCLVIVIESDLWPNHLLAAKRAGVAVAVVNAKLSERSFRLHRWSRLVPRALLSVALIAAQTKAHADRFAGLGVSPERIAVTGNMKYDLTTATVDAMQPAARREQLGFAAPDVVIIGGSLHPGEDLDLLAAFAVSRKLNQRTRLVIVPRYPGHAAAVMENVRRSGFMALAKSEIDRDPAAAARSDAVIVVDTIGELRQLYAAADVAFVGGSLYYRGSNKGGHNLMEPAILGLPVLFGPHNFSFRETVADLLAADAGIEVRDRAELVRALSGLVASPVRRAEMGGRAREVVIAGRGAAQRNLELLLPLIAESASCSANPQEAQCRHQPPGRLLNE